MLSGILSALPIIGRVFDTVDNLSKRIADAKIAALNAGTDRERIAAEERVKSLEARRDVLIKAADLQAGEAKVSPLNIIMRTFGFALPVAILVWKLLVWDKALGQWTGGRTDVLSEQDKWIIVSVIGFYFVAETSVMVARIFKGK